MVGFRWKGCVLRTEVNAHTRKRGSTKDSLVGGADRARQPTSYVEVAHDPMLKFVFLRESTNNDPTYTRRHVAGVTAHNLYKITDLDRCLHAAIWRRISRRLKKCNVSGTFLKYHGVLT